MDTPSYDPTAFVTTEVIGNFLQTTAEEMAYCCARAAYSPNMKERWDVSAGIFDLDGQVVALAAYVPIHLGSMQGPVEQLLAKFPREALRPGDIFIANDPYLGSGSHLPDISLVAPVFEGDELLGFISSVGHHADIGGIVAGSSSARAVSVFQEGLRLPVVRIQDAGRVCQDIIDIVMLNSRTPVEREGDLRAQLSALNVGFRNLRDLCKRYSIARIHRAMAELFDYSERRFRAAVGRLRRGEFTYTDYLDDDGTGGEPVPIKATVRIAEDHVEVDFTGTGAQVPSGFNVPTSATLATVYYALKAFIDPGLPPNAGWYRAVKVIAPEGTLVNPLAPGAVSIRANTCQVVADALFGALSEADPERAYAGCGAHLGLHMGGTNPRTDRYFVHNENIAGSWGARADHDGMDAVHIHITNTANIPIEASEHEFPLVYLQYALLPSAAGAGKFRGGLPVRRDIRIETDDARISLRACRQRVPARGRAGGLDGPLGVVIVNPDTPAEDRLPWTASGHKLERGDVVSIRTAGGAGYGPPAERSAALREQDRLEDKAPPA